MNLVHLAWQCLWYYKRLIADCIGLVGMNGKTTNCEKFRFSGIVFTLMLFGFLALFDWFSGLRRREATERRRSKVFNEKS